MACATKSNLTYLIAVDKYRKCKLEAAKNSGTSKNIVDPTFIFSVN